LVAATDQNALQMGEIVIGVADVTILEQC
jgi:hypothetical protein